MAVNLACVLFYLRERRSDFHGFKHLVVPVAGIAVFIPAWLTAVGLPILPGNFIGRLSKPLSYAGLVVAVWYVLGIIYMFYLYSSAPERIRDTGKVFEEEVTASAP
jgi:hypothetical protein